MNDLFSLAGRTALVTGGSRGIGRMIAAGFLSAGARAVYISSRKAEACDATARELSSLGTCVSLPADVSTLEGVDALVAGVRVGTSRRSTSWSTTPAPPGARRSTRFPEKGWDKVVDLNLKTPFFLTQALHGPLAQGERRRAPGQGDQHRLDRRHLGQSAGDLLVRGEQGRADPADAAHGAAAGAGRHRRQRDRARGVRVGHEPRRARPCRRDQGANPGRRIGVDDDMAGAAIYLASRAGDYVVGSTLVVDGGVTHAR